MEPTNSPSFTQAGRVALGVCDVTLWGITKVLGSERIKGLIPTNNNAPNEEPTLFQKYAPTALPSVVDALYANYDPSLVNQENKSVIKQFLGGEIDYFPATKQLVKSIAEHLPDLAKPHRPLIEQIVEMLVLEAFANVMKSGLITFFKERELDFQKCDLENLKSDVIKYFFSDELNDSEKYVIECALKIAMQNGNQSPRQVVKEFLNQLNEVTFSREKMLLSSLSTASLVTGELLNCSRSEFPLKLEKLLAFLFPEGIDKAIYAAVPSWTASSIAPILKSLFIDFVIKEMSQQQDRVNLVKKGYESLQEKEKESVKPLISFALKYLNSETCSQQLPEHIRPFVEKVVKQFSKREFFEQEPFFEMIEKNGKHLSGQILFKIKERFKDKNSEELANELVQVISFFKDAIEKKITYEELISKLLVFLFPRGFEQELEAIVPLPFLSKFAPALIKKQLASLLKKTVENFLKSFDIYKKESEEIHLTQSQQDFQKALLTFIEKFVPSYLASSPDVITKKLDKQIESLKEKKLELYKILHPQRENIQKILFPLLIAIGKSQDFEVIWKALGSYLRPIVSKALGGLNKTLDEKQKDPQFVYNILLLVLDKFNHLSFDKQDYDVTTLVDPLLNALKMKELPFPKEFETLLMDLVKETIIPSGMIETLLDITFENETKTTLLKKIAEQLNTPSSRQALKDPLETDYWSLAEAIANKYHVVDKDKVISWLKVRLRSRHVDKLAAANKEMETVFPNVYELSNNIANMIMSDSKNWHAFDIDLFPLIGKILKKERLLNERLSILIFHLAKVFPPSFTQWLFVNKNQFTVENISPEIRKILNKPLEDLLDEFLYTNVAKILAENTFPQSIEERDQQKAQEKAQAENDRKELPRMFSEGVKFQYRQGVKGAIEEAFQLIKKHLAKALPAFLYFFIELLLDLIQGVMFLQLDYILFPLLENIYLKYKVGEFYKKGEEKVFATQFDAAVFYLIDALKESFPSNG